ncbi:SDR family oxidoreductase [Actinoplanes sp. TBRC 11911]|uniref:SDR family NAD(P)-dependent oxidoreductase n=1 Tax=Actinoplanes sp. TBRC 11911 TaxID=2729386 RepID=UPI00145C459C|nr:SDR family oxidoreductase [Actinoplanes sp. TBRC 11911]NMO50028.1 SDR family oxidoreductase [Actinoplanes sp. TBRC 11911]
MTDLSGKVALITGAGHGIGRAIALRYASLGADIVINYAHDATEAETARAAVEAYGVRAVTVRADVSVPDDVTRLFRTTVDSFGNLDLVILNAGLEHPGLPVADFTEEEFDRLFAVNTKGAYLTMQAAARHVADQGRIIYVSSSTTVYPMAGYGIHGGSKVAPEYLVQVAARELGPRGITVNGIRATATAGAGLHTDVKSDSPIREFVKDFNPMSRMGTLDDVANVAEFFAGPLSSYVSGQLLLVSGGATA